MYMKQFAALPIANGKAMRETHVGRPRIVKGKPRDMKLPRDLTSSCNTGEALAKHSNSSCHIAIGLFLASLRIGNRISIIFMLGCHGPDRKPLAVYPIGVSLVSKPTNQDNCMAHSILLGLRSLLSDVLSHAESTAS